MHISIHINKYMIISIIITLIYIVASIGPSRYAMAAWPSHAESDRCGVIT